MNILTEFLVVLKEYLVEVLPFLFIGFLLSGLIHEFIPAKLVEKHLGGKGIKPILYSTLAGTILPVCCIGSLPIALSLHQKGARLGPFWCIFGGYTCYLNYSSFSKLWSSRIKIYYIYIFRSYCYRTGYGYCG